MKQTTLLSVTFLLYVGFNITLVSPTDLSGHLQPLGSHTTPSLVDEREDVPNPVEFFNKYVKHGRPVLFKGAAKSFPSFKTWQGDSHLREKYGEWFIEVEEGKKENRSWGTEQMTFAEFLDRYKTEDIYLVQDILPTTHMADEVFLPKCLLCGGYTDLLKTAVLWFSSGGTKSVLHIDEFENINCLYDGSKELVLIDKALYDLVPYSEKTNHSPIDVERVDMQKYPSLSKIPWHRASMEPGDCLYIPYMWYHQVNSSPTRNLAINIWWVNKPKLLHRSQCQNVSRLPEYEKLSKHKFLSESEMLRHFILGLLHEDNSTAQKKSFIGALEDYAELTNDVAVLSKLFDEMDADKSGILAVNEVNSYPSEKISALLFPSDEIKGSKDEL
ncbi:unnamed protein product [Clavelina lepadiformis]|uniref:JmjC domain-containing protein n=1 Tax=Clavelina lepadiformis TaxID=159417 RepID=A0ABP0FL45_CLALP